MESNQDMEMINQAIHKLIEENRIEESSSDVKLSQDDEQLLSRLLSQLESLQESKRSNVVEEETCTSVDKPKSNGNEEEISGEEDIVKELRAVKRQNSITHCLLSALILVTLIWELSEVSLIFKLRNGLNHPFKSFRTLLVGILPKIRRSGTNDVDGGDGSADNNDDNHRNAEER
ncbi:hypothetical protein like AT1G27300 [Hibiscus trionum]|uniref:Uncharacterized protein n=1 Tax=Hibiscus trionum TaxID=183268 RepID=A0A9W7MQV1_HIBTR|nr:hypothetical protein like AT1G27300 [Hibiscus trionum]